MTTRLFLSVIFTNFLTNAIAQELPNAAPASDAMKTRFENTIEYANCRLAQYSVQNTKDAVLNADFMKTCNCNPDGGTNANLKRFFTVHKLGKNEKIFLMTDSLKRAYQPGKTGTELASIITGYFASSKLAQFASNKPNFPDFTKQLSTEIDNRFIGATTTAAPVASSPTSGETGTSPDPIQPATETSESAISKFFNYFIVFLLGVLGGAIGLRFWQQSKAKERRANPDGSPSNANSPDTDFLEQQITALQRELENQKKLNTQLKMRLDDALSPRSVEPPRSAASFVVPPTEDEDDDFEPQTNTANIVDFEENEPIIVNTNTHRIDFEVENTIPPLVTTIQPEPQAAMPRIFFLRLPTPDGLFNDLRKSDIFLPADSVYRMEMIDATHASFAIVPDEDTMKRAIQGFTRYLEPACDLVGNIDTNATIIRTLEEGTVVKEGDVWRIIEKALIDLA